MLDPIYQVKVAHDTDPEKDLWRDVKKSVFDEAGRLNATRRMLYLADLPKGVMKKIKLVVLEDASLTDLQKVLQKVKRAVDRPKGDRYVGPIVRASPSGKAVLLDYYSRSLWIPVRSLTFVTSEGKYTCKAYAIETAKLYNERIGA